MCFLCIFFRSFVCSGAYIYLLAYSVTWQNLLQSFLRITQSAKSGNNGFTLFNILHTQTSNLWWWESVLVIYFTLAYTTFTIYMRIHIIITLKCVTHLWWFFLSMSHSQAIFDPSNWKQIKIVQSPHRFEHFGANVCVCCFFYGRVSAYWKWFD